MIKRIFFLPQLMFVSFVSDIIQFAFIVSTSINSFIKVDADTVGLHETRRPAKPFFHDFNGTDPVVHKAFASIYHPRPEL